MMEALIELVAASFVRHGINAPPVIYRATIRPLRDTRAARRSDVTDESRLRSPNIAP